MSFTLKEYLEAANTLKAAIVNREDISKYGMISVKTSHNPDLKDVFLLNYTPDAAFRKAHEWNVYERVSRGLVLTTDRILAFPFPKFFNLGEEVNSFTVDDVDCVMKKEDGSLGIVFQHKGKVFVTTHGGLDSPQGIWATEFARKNSTFDPPLLESGHSWTRTTHLVEIVYPENRVVTDYGNFEGLISLGSYTFNQHDNSIVYNKPRDLFVDVKDSSEFARWAKENKDFNEEGLVVLLKNGNRVKVKTDAYLAVHKIRFQISEKNILSILLKDPDTFDEWKKTLPNEFFDEVDNIRKEIGQVAYKNLCYVQEVLLHESLDITPDLDIRETKKRIAEHFRKNFNNSLHFSLGMTLHDYGYKVAWERSLAMYFELKKLEK